MNILFVFVDARNLSRFKVSVKKANLAAAQVLKTMNIAQQHLSKKVGNPKGPEHPLPHAHVASSRHEGIQQNSCMFLIRIVCILRVPDSLKSIQSNLSSREMSFLMLHQEAHNV